MVERILRAYYEMKTSFSMFAHRRLFYEIINLAMMSICVANINLNQAQLVIYSIGIIVANIPEGLIATVTVCLGLAAYILS